MQKMVEDTQERHPDAAFITRVFAFTLISTALFFSLFWAGNADVFSNRPKPASVEAMRALSIDKTSLFHSHSSAAGSAAGQGAYPSGMIRSGVVVEAWSANTDANRRACLSLWLFNRAHESLCKALAHTTILAVRESADDNGRIAFVPIESTMHLSMGSRITFKRAIVDGDGRVISLPALSEAVVQPL